MALFLAGDPGELNVAQNSNNPLITTTAAIVFGLRVVPLPIVPLVL